MKSNNFKSNKVNELKIHRSLLKLLLGFNLLISVSIYGQNLSVSYEKDLNDLKNIGPVKHTDDGYVLYYGQAISGVNEYINLSSNNTLIWQSQTDVFLDSIYVDAFFEDATGFYSVGRHTFGKINKNSGNFETRKQFNDIHTLYAINSTYTGNYIIGGETGVYPNGKAALKVINSLGEEQQTKTANETGGIWGDRIYQILKTKDNGYLVVGFIYENTDCNGASNRSLWMCKLDSNLNVTWSKKYGDGNGTIEGAINPDYSGPKAIIIDNNEIVLLGVTRCTNGNGGGINNSGEGTWLMKLNSNGDVVKIIIPIGSSYWDETKEYSDIELSCDGSILLIGTVSAYYGWGYIVEKTDSNFETFANYFSQISFIGKRKWSLQIERGKDESYLISGNEVFYDNNGIPDYQRFVIKTTADQNCITSKCNIGKYCISEDFERFDNGNISPQGNPVFTLHQSGNQAVVTSERGYNSNKSLKFMANSDVNVNINRTLTTPARLEWMTYAGANQGGIWGLFTNSSTKHALAISYNSGEGEVYTYNFNTENYIKQKEFNYPKNSWYKTALILNKDEETIELWIDNEFMYKITDYQSGQVTGLNFFYDVDNPGNTLDYIDDLLYYELDTPCNTTSNISPVCVNGVEYPNISYAKCKAYTDGEIVNEPCSGNPSRTVTIDIDDNICGGPNTEILVPVRVKDYTDIATLLLTIGSSNDNIAEITGVANIHSDSGMSSSDFAVVNKKLVLAYADVSKNLSDNAVLFSIKVQLKGVVGNTANLVFEDNNNMALDIDFQPINIDAQYGSVCINQSIVTISGKITNNKDRGVGEATVEVTTGGSIKKTVTTDNDGNYTIPELEDNKLYTITPEKDGNLSEGVDITDLLLMRRHIQGLTLFNSPYTYVAADLNVDKAIDITDLLYMRRIVQGLTTQLPNGTKAWRFVPESFNFPSGGNPLAGTIPATIELSASGNNVSNLNFKGIKYADLDHSNLGLRSGSTKLRMGEVQITLNDVSGKSGDEVYVNMSVSNFNKAGAMQYSISWPTNLLQLVSVPTGSNEILITGTTLFNETERSNGRLGVTWETDDLVSGTTVNDNTVILRFKFILIGANNTEAEINGTTTPLALKFLDVDLNEQPLKIESGTVSIRTSTGLEDHYQREVNIYPNPSGGNVSLTGAIESIKMISVSDLSGKVLRAYKGIVKDLDLSDLNSGLYLVSIQMADRVVTKKLIINLI